MTQITPFGDQQACYKDLGRGMEVRGEEWEREREKIAVDEREQAYRS